MHGPESDSEVVAPLLRERGWGRAPASADGKLGRVRMRPHQDPELLRRLLRAKDRMDAASHEEWPVAAAGARERRLRGPLRALVQGGLRRPAAPLPAHAPDRAGQGAAARHRPVRSPRSRSRPAGTAWARSGARSATSPARARASCARARRPRRTRSSAVPACFVSAAHRPDLTIAVSEKRRQEAGGTIRPEAKQEVP